MRREHAGNTRQCPFRLTREAGVPQYLCPIQVADGRVDSRCTRQHTTGFGH